METVVLLDSVGHRPIRLEGRYQDHRRGPTSTTSTSSYDLWCVRLQLHFIEGVRDTNGNSTVEVGDFAKSDLLVGENPFHSVVDPGFLLYLLDTG